MKRLVLLDTHAIIHRAYHALPPLTSSGGEPTGAVYGFTSILLRIVKELKPDYLAAAFDLPGPTKRHEAYGPYKAHRPEAPPDLVRQFARVREALEAFHIPVYAHEGYEADDIIGTIARAHEKEKDLEVIIVTGDRDALQLVGPRVSVYAMKKGITDIVMYDEKKVIAQYGVSPRALIEVKALQGDVSDNIPGVRGIGEKTALSLIQEFGSLEKLYRAVARGDAKISARVLEKLEQGKKDAELSRDLGRIHTEVPVMFQKEDARWDPARVRDKDARAFFVRLGFVSLLKRAHDPLVSPGARVVEKNNTTALKKEAQKTLLDAPSESIRPRATLKNLRAFLGKHKEKQFGLMRASPDSLFLIADPDDAIEIPSQLFSEKDCKELFDRETFFVYDGKSLIHFLREYNIELGSVSFDILLAALLISGAGRDVSYLGIVARELGKMVARDPREELSSFFPCARLLQEKIKEEKEEKVFFEIELPLIRTLADMEARGVLLDILFLKKFSRATGERLASLTRTIYADAGKEFNINSPQQLSGILFEKLAIPTRGLKKTEKGGVISTRESELEKLRSRHPIIDKVLQYRELVKLKTTYIDVLPRMADARTRRLSTTFHQLGTSTGRISSSDPNLQNIPIMSEYGREIRKAFIAEKGFSLVSCDYSQIELRVAAHIAEDEKMTQAFLKGADIHKITASEVYNIPLDQVDQAARRSAKTLNFGILYGMGAHGLSEASGMPREQAERFIDEYFRDFSGIKKYIARTKEFAYENGYVETIFGRRRHIPELFSQNWRIKREAERMAVNMPIQGSATGDIVKIAMIKIDQWIQKEKLKDHVRMLLQVHDELLFEIKDSRARELAARIKDIMERAVTLRVPLEVDVKIGKNWGEGEPITNS